MALSADRNTPILGAGGLPKNTNYPVYQSTTIYEGALVQINSTGYLVEATTTSVNITVGIATQHVNNSSGASGDLNCAVLQGVGRFANGNSITKASVGQLCYVVDDQTVTTSAAGSPPVAGTIYAVDSSGVWVYTGLAAPVDGTALTAYEALLAATTAAGGASLVGITDASSLITGATVETALTEITKKANAGLCEPLFAQFALSSIVTATTAVVTWTMPQAGKILRLDGVGSPAPSTTGALATFTVYISDQATSAVLATTTTSLVTRGAIQTGVTATAASYAAGQQISIKSSSVTTYTEGTILLELFLQSA
jgi:hypothetical protein